MQHEYEGLDGGWLRYDHLQLFRLSSARIIFLLKRFCPSCSPLLHRQIATKAINHGPTPYNRCPNRQSLRIGLGFLDLYRQHHYSISQTRPCDSSSCSWSQFDLACLCCANRWRFKISLSNAQCSSKSWHPTSRWQRHLFQGIKHQGSTNVQFRAIVLLLRTEIRRRFPQ